MLCASIRFFIVMDEEDAAEELIMIRNLRKEGEPWRAEMDEKTENLVIGAFTGNLEIDEAEIKGCEECTYPRSILNKNLTCEGYTYITG